MANVRVSQRLAAQILAASQDPIARDMMRRGKNVESAAKRRISVSPKRVDTGRLRASIDTVPIKRAGMPGARIGSKVKYALWVHEGTGLYGPKHARIRPKRARYLRFKPRGARRFIFRKSVKGMRPNPYLRDALPFARL